MAVINQIALVFLVFVIADFSSLNGASASSSTSDAIRGYLKKAGAKNKIKEDQALLNTPFAKLGTSLRVAPLCLSILGQLNLIATVTDVNLIDNTGNSTNKFKYLKYPDSLRASLSQLSSSAYWAFFTANDAMHDIKLRTAKVPEYLGDALKLLFTGLDSEINSLFPIKMAQIREVAYQCKSRSQEVAKKYKDVLHIAQELNIASLRKQGYTKAELEETTLQKELSETKEEQTRLRLERTQELVKRASELFENRSEEFKQAREDMKPNEWEAFGMGFFQSFPAILGEVTSQIARGEAKDGTEIGLRIGESITKSLSAGFKGGVEKMQVKINSFLSERASAQEGKPKPKPKPEKKKVPFATREVVGEIKKLQGSVMRGIGNFFFKNGTLDSKKINPGKGQSAKKITGLLVASDRALKSKISKGANKQLADKGISLIEKLVKLVKDIERESLNNKVKPGTRGKVQYKEFNEYTTTLGSIINSDIPLITGEPAFKKVGPNDPKADSENYREELRNAHLQLNVAQDLLEKAEIRRNSLEEEESKLSVAIQEAMVNLQNYKITEENLSEQLSVLTKGIQAVAHLEKEWSKLTVYFQDFATRVDVLLASPLTDFVKQAEANWNNTLYKNVMAKVSKKVLFDLAYSTSVDAFKINKEAAAYYELSDKHFMPAVATLSELLALDPEKNKNIITQKQKEIYDQSSAMLNEINRALQKKAEDFRVSIAYRKVELNLLFDTEVIKRLPENIQEEAKEIAIEAEKTFEESRQTLDPSLFEGDCEFC